MKMKAETEQRKITKNVKDILEKSPTNLFNKKLEEANEIDGPNIVL